ncbi:MAG: rod shape-determining protein MreD [Halieaceae bacterium]|nr:rod shape-determining protein MreD [Halieaceae bacterium]
MIRARARWVIYVTLFLGLMFVLIPLPLEWRVIRPDAIGLILFYWVIALPHRVGVFTAFCVGFLQDVINGSPLGLSSPGLMLATLFLLLNYERVRQYDGVLQCLVIFMMLSISVGIEQWLRSGTAVPLVPSGAILGLLLSVLCWLPTRTALRRLRRYYEVF